METPSQQFEGETVQYHHDIDNSQSKYAAGRGASMSGGNDVVLGCIPRDVVNNVIDKIWTWMPHPSREHGEGGKKERIAIRVAAGLLCWFVVWNFSKLPWLPTVNARYTNVTYNKTYCEDITHPLDMKCVGPEMQANLIAWAAWRGNKIITDVALFQAPHMAMGCLIDVCLVIILLVGFHRSALIISKLLLPLTFVFALHIFPVEEGFPTRVTLPVHINLGCLFLLFLAVSCGCLGYFFIHSPRMEHPAAAKLVGEKILFYSIWVIGIVVNLAPFAEMFLVMGGSNVPPEGNKPHPRSGHLPYAASGCPQAVGWLATAFIFIGGGVFIGLVIRHFVKTRIIVFGGDSGHAAPNVAVDAVEDGRPSEVARPSEVQPAAEPIFKVQLGPWANRRPAVWQLWTDRNPRWMHPETYLAAWVETFIVMLCVSWLATKAGNPAAIDRNRIKDIMGYNNVCVGFDTPPARYFAAPLMVLQAYYGLRYVLLDNWRAELEKEAGEIAKGNYWCTRVCNLLFAGCMLAWPMLLIITPGGVGWHLNTHFYIYVFFVVVSFCTIGANFAEARQLTVSSTVWIFLFGLDTVLLLGVGYIAFNSYDYKTCPTNNVASLPRSVCEKDPLVPVWFLSFVDYMFFILLAFTPMLLPGAPKIYLRATAAANEQEGVAEIAAMLNND